ncbi:restriction endonuclease [Sphingomonas carotinifaciens]|uniref:nSTAND3 domain-containing NTPase n=1 Tax=Sphingomonas carotinifaciens TaxID=1166323 RepID=UPI00399FF8EF
MTYSFASLSPADFEDLARDVAGQTAGCRFEAFGPGPDGGIDGRHAKSGAAIILQAKHYRVSGFSALAREMRRERAGIDTLSPSRYILVTSVSMTPANKKALSDIIGPSLKASEDIIGFEDLNGLLRQYDDIAKSHVKLWLSDTAILERVLQAATHNFNMITEADIRAKLRVYAQNPSFSEGRGILESQRILIISGPPGVGKTTLGEMLSYAYIGEDWQLVSMRALDDGFERIDDRRRQVFFFDDFLGRIALDERALSNQDSAFGRFIARVRRTPTARFILTTRAYIYQAAKLASETLADQRLDVARYVLDVGTYTRRIKARILYNHLIVAGAPVGHLAALAKGGAIKKIVDHAHYNPRIVEWMTDSSHITDIPAENYPEEFVETLDHPDRIWEKPFRNHISRKCQHLLIALYFASEYGVLIEELRELFEAFNPRLCIKFNIPYDPKDFEDALKTLEGSFLIIVNGSVSFTNPSVRDFLSRYLNDKTLLIAIAGGASNANCAQRIVDQFRKIPELTSADTLSLLTALTEFASRLNSIPNWRPVPGEVGSYRLSDKQNGDRIAMLLGWWRSSDLSAFLDAATQIARAPVGGFSAWSDARTLPDILVGLLTASQAEQRQTSELVRLIEDSLRTILRTGLEPDDLDRLLKAIDENSTILHPLYGEEIATAIPRMIDEIGGNLAHIDSESTLADYIDTVEKLAARVEYSPDAVATAKNAIERRINEVREQSTDDEELSVTGDHERQVDRFDDADLVNLFAPLLVDISGDDDDNRSVIARDDIGLA